MRTFLKYLIILLVLLAIIAVALMFFSPSKMVFERTKTIDAPPAMVYNMVNDLKKWEAWSPWKEIEPAAENTYTQKTEGVGAKWTWKGEKLGEGSQYILENAPHKSIKLGLTFGGWDGESISNWNFEEEGGKTKVRWDFVGGETPFVMRPFNLFMKGGLEDTYDKGLANIARIAEQRSQNKTYNGHKINEVYIGKKNYVMNRQVVKMENIQQFYTQNLSAIFMKTQGENIEMDGMPSGLFYAKNESNGTTDMAAAIPLKEPTNVPGFISQTLPDGQAVQVDYYGDYSNISTAHEAIDSYMKDHGLLVNYPVVEEYVTDPTTEKDPKKWLTKVTYYVINSTQ